MQLTDGVFVDLQIKEYPEELVLERETKDLRLNVGMYKSPEVFLKQFEHVTLR